MTTILSPKPNIACVYCTSVKIKEREVIKSNDLARAFPTNIPITPGHTLVAPIRCVQRMEDLTKEEKLAILDLAAQIMNAMRLVYHAEGFNCVWNQEKLAGQSVPHFHLHIIARKKNDTGVLGYDPRSMLYRTGDREPISEDELLKSRDKLGKALKEVPFVTADNLL
jgi:diadenosine tetraphosphate (Ap4A) HIT family hydrolase